MNIIDTQLVGVKIIEPKIWRDERGFFMETFREDWFRAHIADCQLVQHNHSCSQQNVLRGLHFQWGKPQAKLIRVVSGSVLDVAVDLRQDSPTFGQWISIVLSAENARQLWLPEGFAHGFYAQENHTQLIYQCSDYYHPESERILLWSDSTLAIDWQLHGAPIISEKDKHGKTWQEIEKF
ncbi:MAG: dTDP-4-dehydrorhamnose 3,5-epimerase [Neisseriaceae bacterium]|nr:dTDP-4-dehydrorhamnose 3,5-epimerase [Neisseriaceae bacterium]